MSAAAAAAGSIWSSAAFERIADGAAASHDALVTALDLAPGARLLDVATGTGAVALRAAERGAVVTAVDIAAELLERARRAATELDLSVEFHVADAERLPFPSSSFEVVASAQGVVFAADREAIARELGRVCKPGGVLGLTCPVGAGFALELAGILASFRPGAWLGPFAWGDENEVKRLLGHDFELDFEKLAAPFRVATPHEGWHVYRESFGPLVGVLDSLGPAGSAELRVRVLELLARYVTPEGVVAPRPLLLVVGRRRLASSARTGGGTGARTGLMHERGADIGLDAVRDSVRTHQRHSEAGEVRLGVCAADRAGLLERGRRLLKVRGRNRGDAFALRGLRGLARRACGMRACAEEIGADDERAEQRE